MANLEYKMHARYYIPLFFHDLFININITEREAYSVVNRTYGARKSYVSPHFSIVILCPIYYQVC